MNERSVIFDHQGKYYTRLAGENREVVPFDRVSNHFVNALISREDTRFYSHKGVDPIGIARAAVRNLLLGGFREGASTITQQLARNSFPLGGKTIHRKLIEAALAFRIETELTKEEILEAYINRIYFGSGTYGLEAASQVYFGKPASKLNLQESATLAGLIRSPNRFSPLNNPEGSIRERNTVLGRMRDLELINEAQYVKAAASPLVAMPRTKTWPEENWAMDAILRELELVLEPGQMDEGGLKIFTTIDGPLQAAAEKSVAARLAQTETRPGYPHQPMSAFDGAVLDSAKSAPYLEAAAIALDNSTGGIRAIVGGRDYSRSKFHRALYGKRQAGSVVKPFVYAAAFEAGVAPNEPISDDRIQPGEMPREFGSYDPANSDGTHKGLQPAGEGLIQSRNTMSVRLGLRAGLDRIASTIQRAGVAPEPEPYPSICLGAFETGLKDLTAAYTVFATGGVKMQPYLIDRVLDSGGHVLYQSTRGRIPVLNPAAARMTTSLLEDAVSRGTAAGARQLGLKGYGAGKTGTTNNYVDAWFVGFDKNTTCGVWVGFDSPKAIMPGGYGGALALPIWVDIIEASKRGG
ncbi:MAG: PBP1A family penicillin-binding protein [Verrucomicrobia bacterium]|nr:PBP1A family penicillin-binding protein [Verrucomicrobiota bacterium]